MDDKILRQFIIDEFDYEPSIDAANIGVAVENGVVTLTGHVANVPDYAEKITAERTVSGRRRMAISTGEARTENVVESPNAVGLGVGASGRGLS